MTKPVATLKQSSNEQIRKLQDVFEGLTPETRETLARAGVTVPEGDIEAIVQGKHKYGLRCTQCQRIALYFVGDTWTIDGIVYDEPPPVPHRRVAWTQNLPSHEIDRNEPRCQHCKVPVPLQPDGSFMRDRRLTLMEKWNDSRDQRYDKAKAKDVVKQATKIASQVPKELAPTGVGTENFNASDRPVSQVIAEQRGVNVLPQIEAIAAASGVTQAVKTGKLE